MTAIRIELYPLLVTPLLLRGDESAILAINCDIALKLRRRWSPFFEKGTSEAEEFDTVKAQPAT
ncbi:MAG: hypothetical protein H6Q17_1084 [Bacteroidetes bacterium]|nr:hypothetical protein [Bacteroidota bacterium]